MTPGNDPIDVQPSSKEATVLCALYRYEEYGFRAEDLSRFTTLKTSSATKALANLYQQDVLGKTDDGYYHALDDACVSKIADDLEEGEHINLATGKKDYPDNMSGTTIGQVEENDE